MRKCISGKHLWTGVAQVDDGVRYIFLYQPLFFHPLLETQFLWFFFSTKSRYVGRLTVAPDIRITNIEDVPNVSAAHDKCRWTSMNQYTGADKSLSRPGRKQANVFVRVAWISFGALPCRKINVMTARVSMLLKSRASLTCFRACFLVGPRIYQHPDI